jgi:hypothetical protein
MARQKGVLKLEGSIGDISFYKSQDGYFARMKGGVDGERIKNDPKFARTRENGSEFGRAGKGGKLLRNALRVLLLNTSDNRMASRLTREMLKVIKADSTNSRGERTIVDGDIELIELFEFNKASKLGTVLFMPYSVNVDRQAGEVTVDIQDFVPQNSIAAPSGATHAKFVMAAAEVDFDAETFSVETENSSEVEIGNQTESAIALTATIPTGSTLPVFAVIGVEFFQEVNGNMYPLSNGAYNALQLHTVDV